MNLGICYILAAFFYNVELHYHHQYIQRDGEHIADVIKQSAVHTGSARAHMHYSGHFLEIIAVEQHFGDNIGIGVVGVKITVARVSRKRSAAESLQA